MPVMEGVEAVRHLREIDPQAKVIVLTTYDADEDIARALQAGAKAYILKDISADELIACVHAVLAGKTYLAPAAAPSWPSASPASSSRPASCRRCG
jgi:DNA-binding NarL/FixJ family response regulator